MWLFGRRRKKAANKNDGGPAAVTDRTRPVADQTHTTQNTTALRRTPSHRQRRQRESLRSRASLRDAEKALPHLAFTKDAWPQSSVEDITALPRLYRLEYSPHLRPIAQEHGAIPYNFQSRSHASLPPSAKDRGKLQRPQSMRRDLTTDSSLVRRKSSKRRKEHDHVREEEIRTMTLPMPQKRPAASSGGMLRRDSKKVKGALNHRFERPTSNVSLPLADSIHSSMSGSSENREFRRRREKKAKADQERLRRRLERRAEKQNAAEARGTPGTPRKEGTGIVGLGIDKDASMSMEDVRPSTPQRSQRLDMPVTPRTNDNNQLPTPLDSPVDEPVVSDARAIRYSRGSVSAQVHTREPSNASILPELISKQVAHDTPVGSIEQAHDPTRSGSLHPVDTADTFATSKQGSSTRRRSSEGKRMGVFASLFRRGKRDQAPAPSEHSFSNTSRESMSRQPLPAHLVGNVPASKPIQIQRPSSVPRRTMSKFREDLPEFPLSPPDSRVQSPEAQPRSAIAARRLREQPSDLRLGSLSGDRSDSPVSPGAPVNAMSRSLASVDSEASWLSGRPPKRSQMRSSLTSSVQRTDDFNASYEELGMADDEYFNKLTNRPDQRGRSPYGSDDRGRKASSTLMRLDTAAESDEERDPAAVDTPSNGEQYVKSSVGRQPTIIHRRPRIKSAEGLLSMFTDELDRSSKVVDIESESPTSPTSDTDPGMLQRAKSVDLGKGHVRHLSAGSARLLDIQKRTSSPVQGGSNNKF
ncbi:hypothetical protein PtrV1_03448 [Pyrenophora tritici-repentis]|uniref:Uncharacterized protein n=1 Tax=Pyrenophora tritici-repentis TaxID=45151 RepID=A0A5M9LUL3_9PLEO|nr:hypothetical protein PtrV1_03448 [Pyrenophora tritici-repentis]KAF7579439.1 hypothetical protein PtrM4_036790 [Pyrenophora tritici-repentis]